MVIALGRGTMMMLATALLSQVHCIAGAINENGTAYLEKISDDKNFIQHESGFYYKIITAGNESAPPAELESVCNLSYTASLTDGTAFDGTRKPKEIIPGKMFPGFKKALMLMHPGAKWTVVIPPDLAFGDDIYGKVPASSVLVFDIELHNVLPPPEGIWKMFNLAMRFPQWVLAAGLIIKFLLDYLFNIKEAGGLRMNLEMVMNKPYNPKVTMEVIISDKSVGTMEIELFSRILPMTSDLFQTMCVSAPKKSKGKAGKKGSAPPANKFKLATHIASQTRVTFTCAHTMRETVPNYALPTVIEYDNGHISHDARYLVSIADAAHLSPTRPIEFFVSKGPAKEYDGTHVVVGRIVNDASAMFDAIEKAAENGEGVEIGKCTVTPGEKKKQK